MKNYKPLLGFLCFLVLSSYSYSQESKTQVVKLNSTQINDSLHLEFFHHFEYNTTLRITDSYNREIMLYTISPLTHHLNVYCGRVPNGKYFVCWENKEVELARHNLVIAH